MPRYFFNFVGNECAFLDKEGIELTDIANVREYAHRRAAELTEAAEKAKDISGWRIQICDENGVQIMSLSAEPDLLDATGLGSNWSKVHLNRED
jgi:hypothetical protein